MILSKNVFKCQKTCSNLQKTCFRGVEEGSEGVQDFPKSCSGGQKRVLRGAGFPKIRVRGVMQMYNFVF